MAPTALLIAHNHRTSEQLTRKLERTGIFGGIIPFRCDAEALSHMQQHAADILFCTVDRADQTSLSCLTSLSQRAERQDLPLIAITRETDHEGRIASLEQGASDCISFDTLPQELAARIQALLKRQARITELRRTAERLTQMAQTDGLTGLSNRAFFDRALEHEVARTERSRVPFSLMLLDIDHFKRLNDTYGHQTGDLVLQAVAGVLLASARTSDVVCRYGGEEFGIILPETTAPKAVVLANRIHHNLANLSLQLPQINQPITISIGIKCISGKTHLTAWQVVEEADRALYDAKRNGRDRTEIARSSTPVMPISQSFRVLQPLAAHA